MSFNYTTICHTDITTNIFTKLQHCVAVRVQYEIIWDKLTVDSWRMNCERKGCSDCHHPGVPCDIQLCPADGKIPVPKSCVWLMYLEADALCKPLVIFSQVQVVYMTWPAITLYSGSRRRQMLLHCWWVGNPGGLGQTVDVSVLTLQDKVPHPLPAGSDCLSGKRYRLPAGPGVLVVGRGFEACHDVTKVHFHVNSTIAGVKQLP